MFHYKPTIFWCITILGHPHNMYIILYNMIISSILYDTIWDEVIEFKHGFWPITWSQHDEIQYPDSLKEEILLDNLVWQLVGSRGTVAQGKCKLPLKSALIQIWSFGKVLEAESYRPAIDLLTWPLPEQLHWTDLGPKATLFPVTCQCQVAKNIRYALCKVLISWLVSAGHSQVPQKKIPQTAVCMFPKLGTTKNPDSSLTELDHRMGRWHLPVYSARTHTLNCR